MIIRLNISILRLLLNHPISLNIIRGKLRSYQFKIGKEISLLIHEYDLFIQCSLIYGQIFLSNYPIVNHLRPFYQMIIVKIIHITRQLFDYYFLNHHI